jgi:hypothetical protein
MKRLLLSLLGGFVIPLLYAIIVGPLSTYTESWRIKYILWAPIGWPRILQFYLFSSPFGPGQRIGDATFAVIQIACDVALYGSLTYIFLLTRSLRKRKSYTGPPPPPVFGRDE